MNNEVNETNNQTISGVKVVMPDAKPVDATTADVGAANSNVRYADPQPTSITPQVVQPTTQPVQTTPTIVPTSIEKKPVVVNEGNNKKVKKRKNRLVTILLLIIVSLTFVCVGLYFFNQQQMNLMRAKCTPVSTEEEKTLALDSTIVKDLYGKVSTNLREDLGSVELNDQLKMYLAFRQIANTDIYDSNCNKFSSTSMEPFVCEKTTNFIPKAFKEETLQLELKKLFGEDTYIDNQNIQLDRTCIGGYQYIKERGEYVQGQCNSAGATLYRVEKQLINATSTASTIVLTEKVKYYGAEALKLPEKLVSGTYKYTFRLDMNYNYVYVSKEFISR